MSVPKIFNSEYRFCLILWEHEPISSRELSELCREQLGWSKTTTYTVIKRLSDRGVVINENTIVRALISKEDAQAVLKAELQIQEVANKTAADVSGDGRIDSNDAVLIRQYIKKTITAFPVENNSEGS